MDVKEYQQNLVAKYEALLEQNKLEVKRLAEQRTLLYVLIHQAKLQLA